MKKIISCICMFATSVVAYGKAVDESTAKTVAHNFYQPKANLQDMSALSLAYTRTSVINGASVADLYIFNAGRGFVIVSGDDNVMPILGYSTESNFTADRINPSFKYLLDNYADQIAYAIRHNTTATTQVAGNWNDLKTGTAHTRAARTTLTSVAPLITTKWDQENPATATPYLYNANCPYDSTAATPGKTLTGCVATAMSQVMKHWNWPDTGVGTNTYTQTPDPDGIAAQTANFAIPFHFDSMPVPKVTALNTYVAKLMYCAGVSVDMNYGTESEDGSGAYVTSDFSPVTNCAEYALKTYFKYPAAKGYQRKNFTQAQWVDSMLNEMNSGRPVIYAGNGPQGGHCWVMDGYDNDSFFHFNWGWSGYYNGYFTINSVTPDFDTFNKHQEAIIRIVADTPVHSNDSAIVVTGVTTVPSAANNIRVFPNPATSTIHVSFEGLQVTEIRVMDIEGREMKQLTLPNSVNTIVIPVSELPGGMYLLRLQTSQGMLARKFVIAK